VAADTPTPTQLYLELIKRSLTNSIYGAVMPRRPAADAAWKRWIVKALHTRDLELVQRHDMDGLSAQRAEAGRLRMDGSEWLPEAHTMIGRRRLDSLQHCVEDALARDVPGDLVECGVWRGGASIFMRAVLEAHGVADRAVWLADSFQGLPPPNTAEYPADSGDLHHTVDELAVSMAQVQENFRRYSLLDERVRFLPGWFKDTLAGSPIEQVAVLRIDGDMYESTIQVLDALYARLSSGGYVIVDDYGGIPACKRAVDEFRAAHGISDEIHEIDWTGIFWRASEGGATVPGPRATPHDA